MRRIRFNAFAPDPEDTIRLNVTNNADDSDRLRAQLEGFGVSVVSLTPSHQGSFDIVVTGTVDQVNAVLDHFDVPFSDWEYI